MKTFKSVTDLEQLLNHPAYNIVMEAISPYINDSNYHPSDDGYVALIEPGDVNRVLTDLDMPWRLSL